MCLAWAKHPQIKIVGDKLIPILYEAARNNELYLPFGLSSEPVEESKPTDVALGFDRLSPNGRWVHFIQNWYKIVPGAKHPNIKIVGDKLRLSRGRSIPILKLSAISQGYLGDAVAPTFIKT